MSADKDARRVRGLKASNSVNRSPVEEARLGRVRRTNAVRVGRTSGIRVRRTSRGVIAEAEDREEDQVEGEGEEMGEEMGVGDSRDRGRGARGVPRRTTKERQGTAGDLTVSRGGVLLSQTTMNAPGTTTSRYFELGGTTSRIGLRKAGRSRTFK